MSGDSPSAHTNNVFDFIDGRNSPTPTTSKELGTQGLVAAQVLVENREDEKEKTIFTQSSKLHDSETDREKPLKLEANTEFDGKGDPPNKLGGSKEKLNATWIPPPNQTKKEDEEDDNCVVKCLYYTMQCCECTIS